MLLFASNESKQSSIFCVNKFYSLYVFVCVCVGGRGRSASLLKCVTVRFSLVLL